jgi:UTP--glucose-1-phosphate uridylyltransferase
MTLDEQLQSLAEPLRARLAKRGFDADKLRAWAAGMARGEAERNHLRGQLAPVKPSDIDQLPQAGSGESERLSEIGAEAIARGELALCVLAGGMATRMGGVVKATVELAPGFTFLDVPLCDRELARRRYGRAPALWLMTSEPTDGPIREALGQRRAPLDVATFEQFVSLRLTEQGEIFYDDDGDPSVYATGHGDLPDALSASGLLARHLERGGRYVWISNLDNLGARIDAALLGQHIEESAALTVELVDKKKGDKGGGPVLHDGAPIIAENFRVPPSFNLDAVPVFNTNTFIVNADALDKLELDWTYVEVKKDVGSRRAVQFERLLGEMTVAITPRFVRVPRDGQSSRFLAVKTQDDMAQMSTTIAELVDALRRGSVSV